ncbi:phage terminase small subunit [Citrobacter portucalensis]|uniref:phage terminase small subunit n=1 Tax=Citrobacter portucalensis TaxID=1639133 RepID=UPI00226B4A35|nr:phage terminase small subunit [Citrobacter portucalensis]MCX9038813.1 phage terminase small subunit [Citrobacter portucalensis]
MMTSPARAHRLRVEAELTARPGGQLQPMSGYSQMLLQLSEDMTRLKAVQSTERKVELKRELLPKYVPWVDGILAGDGSRQDDVVMNVLIWRIDAGDYDGALVIAAHALRHRWVLPARYNRTTATAIAEEFADAAMAAFTLKASFSAPLLLRVLELVDAHDMPDQSRARLHKALGYALRDNGQAVAAMNHLTRALQLDTRIGVKKDIEQLQRQLRQAVNVNG